MKCKTVSAVSLGLGLLLVSSFLARAANDQAAGFQMRHHMEHSVFTELPFAEGDLSYGLAYEYHNEDKSFFQFALDFTPDVTGTSSVDTAWTPRINLFAKDRFWRAGIGISKSYLKSDTTGNDWTDLYWQGTIGVNIPFSRKLGLDLCAFYDFDKWNKLSDFDFGDVEYGALLKYFF